ncbi:hypothetical protein ACSBOB_19335 [Mesorhizobium sp. ASY16-5R]|uniref:hypothetical protein n=1 Tax=Mesorhizobium sp. ASY16-5R TaxID=3445772 RepID=UPI003F9F441F
MRGMLLVSVLACGFALPASAQSIGGTYSVEGTNFDGSPYKGEAEIKLAGDTTCAIKWSTGGSTSQGICMRNKDAFAAFYALGKSYGLVVYKVMADGSMQGLWTIYGQNGGGTEILTPK